MRQVGNPEKGGDFGSWRRRNRNAFLAAWLRANIPPFYKPANVVQLAAKLRVDAAAAGVDLRQLESSGPLAVEQIILSSLNPLSASR
jgi:hypothetical protein